MSTNHGPLHRFTERPWFVVAVIVLAIAVVVLVLATLYAWRYSGRIYPRVSVSGVDLGGLTLEQASVHLAEQLPAYQGTITLRDPEDNRTWTRSADDLGLVFDSLAVADAAYQVGREGRLPLSELVWPVILRLRGRELPAEAPFDEGRARLTLAELAPEVDLPPRDAELRFVDGELVETPPTLGRQLDMEGTLVALGELARSPGPATVDIVTAGTAPRVGDIESVAEAYRRVTSGPVRLTFRPDFMHVIDADLLSEWVSIEELPNEQGDVVPSIVVDEAAIRRYVEPLAEEINRPVENARFQYNIHTGAVTVKEPAQIGYRLDPAATAGRIIDAAYTEPRVAEAAVHETRPQVFSDTARELSHNVREIGRASTRFTGAPEGRVKNLLLAAQSFHGVTLPPGGEFSFNEILGEVTAAEGYDMVHIDGGSAPDGTGGLAGGISQVATTAFRAAFWGGFPITTRRAPTQRIGWTEAPIGLDAAAGTRDADFRFTNDSDGHLLIQTEMDTDRGALTWVLYGLPRERRVEVVGPEVVNVTPAGDLIVRRDPELPAGTRVQVDWAREGAETTVIRTVSENGEEILRDTFSGRYAPSSDVVVEGTGLQ